MKIAFDVMGSDYGSRLAVAAALQLVNEFTDTEVILVGNESEINNNLTSLLKHRTISPKITIYGTTQVVRMTDGPLAAIRMDNSSMYQAIKLVKDKIVDAVLTSGSSAAYIGACHLLLGEIKGIKRPAFMSIMPTIIKGQQVVLLDAGANLENNMDELIDFALMGHTYCQLIQNIVKPKIGLLNIGVEANKGTLTTKATYAKLQALTASNGKLNFLNFHGNIEPRNILTGEVNIIVCEGYVGNIAIKAIEGMALVIFSLIKKGYRKNLFSRFLGLLSFGIFKNIKAAFDYKNTGGAQLIGINGIAFKAHGASEKTSFYSALKLCRSAIKQDVTNKISEQLKNYHNNK